MSNIITEIYGLGNEILRINPNDPAGQDYLNRDVNVQIKGNPNRDYGRPTHIDLEVGRPLSNWQNAIYLRMLHKKDTFAGVPPAAGKTSPMKKAWSELFIQSLLSGTDKRSKQFPRLLYIAKTKQLAMEGILQNFHGWIFDFLSRTNSPQPGVNLIRLLDPTMNIQTDTPMSHDLQNKLFMIAQNLSAVRLGGISPQEILSPLYYIKPIIVTTPIITPGDNSSFGSKLSDASKGYFYDYKQVADLVAHYGDYFSMIIIDEFQQYMPMPGKKFNNDSEKNFDMIFKILKHAPKPGKCGVHLLTGTVNKETATQFCKLIDSELGRNFSPPNIYSGMVRMPDADGNMKTDPAVNRSKLVVTPFEAMSDPKERVEICSRIVRSKQSRSIMIIFSTRRSAVTGIFNLLGQLIRKLPLRDANSLLDKPIPTDKNIRDLYKSNLDPDKNYINPDYNSLSYPKGLIPDEITANDIEYLKYFDIDSAEQQGNSDSKLLKTPNENNLLYLGVRAGIGVMNGKMDDRMKATIQKLFRSEKIYLLLATDSLGIGANVLCKHLYLPSLEKIDEGVFDAIDDSSLIQLFNRAGRDVTLIPNAFIYCNIKDYPRILKAVGENPENFVKEVPFDQIKERVKNKNSVLRSLYNELF